LHRFVIVSLTNPEQGDSLIAASLIAHMQRNSRRGNERLPKQEELIPIPVPQLDPNRNELSLAAVGQTSPVPDVPACASGDALTPPAALRTAASLTPAGVITPPPAFNSVRKHSFCLALT
jgi:hypothetical protein